VDVVGRAVVHLAAELGRDAGIAVAIQAIAGREAAAVAPVEHVDVAVAEHWLATAIEQRDGQR